MKKWLIEEQKCDPLEIITIKETRLIAISYK